MFNRKHVFFWHLACFYVCVRVPWWVAKRPKVAIRDARAGAQGQDRAGPGMGKTLPGNIMGNVTTVA